MIRNVRFGAVDNQVAIFVARYSLLRTGKSR